MEPEADATPLDADADGGRRVSKRAKKVNYAERVTTIKDSDIIVSEIEAAGAVMDRYREAPVGQPTHAVPRTKGSLNAGGLYITGASHGEYLAKQAEAERTQAGKKDKDKSVDGKKRKSKEEKLAAKEAKRLRKLAKAEGRDADAGGSKDEEGDEGAPQHDESLANVLAAVERTKPKKRKKKDK